MSRTPLSYGRLVPGLLCTLLLGTLVACETVTTAPADSRLTGSWTIDKAASDNAEAQIAAAMKVAQDKLRNRLAHYGYGADANDRTAGDNGADAPDYTYDTPEDARYGRPGRVGPDFRGLRLRLRQALTPPNALQLDVKGDLVTISSDTLPPREYHLGERLSRIDEYGTSQITATRSQDTFELNFRYTSHASHSESYRVDPVTGALNLTQQIDDPTVGKIQLHSLYRRAAGSG